MITINTLGDKIVGSYSGTPFSVEYSKERFDSMTELVDSLEDASDMDEARDIVESFKELTIISAKAMVESACENLFFNPANEKYYLQLTRKEKGKTITMVSSIPMPKTLVDRILSAVDKDHDVEPMIKFWTRLLRNPVIREQGEMNRFATLLCDYVSATYVDPILEEQFLEQGYSESVARDYATIPQTPFTKEGLICTKKVVDPVFNSKVSEYTLDDNGRPVVSTKTDFQPTLDPLTGEMVEVEDPETFSEDWVFQPAIHLGGEKFACGSRKNVYIYMVGQEARLPSWESVNCNSNQGCVKGLHTGNQNYIKSWEHLNNVTLNCFVDPGEVGAVSQGEHVLRVRAFYPHSIKSREESNRQLYFSSDYAAQTDLVWEEDKKEAIERFEMTQREIMAANNAEIKSVLDEMTEVKSL